MNIKYRYPAEKFAAARRTLMAPHPSGEASSYAGAYHECVLGLHDIRDEDLDDNARSWVATIRRCMDTQGIDDPTGKGTALIKAERLSIEEKYDFSHAVDDLAHWFQRASR